MVHRQLEMHPRVVMNLLNIVSLWRRCHTVEQFHIALPYHHAEHQTRISRVSSFSSCFFPYNSSSYLHDSLYLQIDAIVLKAFRVRATCQDAIDLRLRVCNALYRFLSAAVTSLDLRLLSLLSAVTRVLRKVSRWSDSVRLILSGAKKWISQ